MQAKVTITADEILVEWYDGIGPPIAVVSIEPDGTVQMVTCKLGRYIPASFQDIVTIATRQE